MFLCYIFFAKTCFSPHKIIHDFHLLKFSEFVSRDLINEIFCCARLNVCDRKEWETAWKCIEENFGQIIQILVNNAGVKAAFGWKSCLEVNLYGTMIGSFLARDQMGKTKVRKSFFP